MSIAQDLGQVRLIPDESLSLSCVAAPSAFATRRSFRLRTIQELEDCSESHWIIDEILPGRALVEMHGQPASGKTFLGLDLALHTASGVAWCGRNVSVGPVVYIIAEGSGGILKRIKSWLIERRVDTSDIPFRVLMGSVQLLDPQDAEALHRAIAALPAPPILIVIDPLARCFVGADENSAAHMGTLIAACGQLVETFGSTVLLIHHTTKEGGHERGSSALRGAMDTMLQVKREGDEILLSCSKQKDFEEFEPMRFTLERVSLGLDENGEEVCGCRIGPMGLGTGRHESHEGLGASKLVILTTLRDSFFDEGAPGGVLCEASPLPKSTYHRNIKWLVESGYVEREPAGRGYRYRLTGLWPDSQVSSVPLDPTRPDGTQGRGPTTPSTPEGGECGTDPPGTGAERDV